MLAASHQAARGQLRKSPLLATSNPNPNAPRSAPPTMEGANTGQHKLSRGPSAQGARGFLGSRRFKRTEEPEHKAPTRSQTLPAMHGHEGKGKEREQPEPPPPQPSQPLMPFRSIVPDPLGELPPWYTTDAELSTPTTQLKSRYPLHNPVGPRYYRNHHLLPPSLNKRPSSVFSPSFPPMAARADISQDMTKLAGPSRTPSGSPMPSPNSSQVRIHDVRARTRKISQTNADGLDATDPGGINWHHHSPYDVGRRSHEKLPSESPTLPESPASTASRVRRRSMSAITRHKTVVPSPLSQSTSAVHLSSEPLAITVSAPRRLSKRRKPFRGLFGSSSESEAYRSQSTSNPGISAEVSNILGRKVSRTGSIVPASITSSAASVAPTEKQRRGSVLGRLVKRFSVLRRSDATRSVATSTASARPSVSENPAITPTSTGRASPQKPSLQHSQSSDVSNRVPAPSVRTQTTQHNLDEDTPQEVGDNHSVSSAEGLSLSIGKLMIANPDILPTGKEESPRVDTGFERILDSLLSSSPGPTPNIPRYPPPPLSVISEGETIMSSPRVPPIGPPHIPPASPIIVPRSPLAMPSVPPSLMPPALKTEPSPVPAPAPSPPLPDLPPPTPAPVLRNPKMDASLPPTPAHTRPSTPSSEVPTVPSISTLPNGRHIVTTVSPSAESTSLPKVEDPALARASMYVNPPTPYVPSIVIPQSPPPPVSSIPSSQAHARSQSQDDRKSPRDPSPTKKDSTHRVKRRTETFKLVRSPSGNVHTVGGGSFVVAGEHWGVVESSDHKNRKEKSRSNDAEAASGKESKKQEKESTDEDSEQQKKHHRKSVRQPSDIDGSSSSQHHARTPTSESGRRGSASERRRSTRERESVVDTARATQTPVIYAQPVVTPTSAHRPTTNYSTAATSTKVERRTSTSTRPTSEFQSAADLNALKAKEAWEMERLWKGRSMIYGPEGGAGLVNIRPNIGSDSRPSTILSADLHRASTIPSVGDLSNASTATIPLNNGSSHTYFMVQAPYNGASSSPPHPPIIYPGLPAPAPQGRSPSAHYDLPKSYPFPSTTDLPSPRSNPLPEPPRLSSYRASPLPPSLAGTGEGPSSPEYWTKYAGVTSSH